jgi:SNF2 family DNA or RNA helicase
MISRGAIADYIERDLDSFLWMKKLLRSDIEAELRTLKVVPYFKTKPWLHQLVCFYIALCHPRFLFLLDMGLGKSKIIMDILTQVQREKKLKHAIITVPRVINIDSWQDDILLHSDLQPWHCDVEDTEEKWERLLKPQGDVTIIDYQGLHWALSEKVKGKKGKKLVPDEKRINQVKKLYNFIAADESHKLGNHESLWWMLMNRLMKDADYCYATTGTLFSKDVEAAWSQFYLVDRGETFGENLGLFRGAFFTEKSNPWKGLTYHFNKRMERDFYRTLQHRSLRYESAEVPEIDLPSRRVTVSRMEMSPEQHEHYLRAAEGLINANGNLRELEGQWIRMRQIVSGYLVWKDSHGDHIARFKQNPKLDDLERWLDEIGGAKAVVAYDYTETGRIISERLKSLHIDHEWFYGGTKDQSASRRRFIDDPKCRVFVMNSAAGGEGTNGLQKVSRYMYLYETPTSPTLREQLIKRIHRPGQKDRCFITDAVMRRSVDQGILDDIAEGTDLYQRVVNGKGTGKSVLFSG